VLLWNSDWDVVCDDAQVTVDICSNYSYFQSESTMSVKSKKNHIPTVRITKQIVEDKKLTEDKKDPEEKSKKVKRFNE